ncbi:MAG: hypothetical protein U0232_03365 [Thermomicrobiales bacterium]
MKHRHFSLPALLAIVAMLLFPLARIPAVGAAQAAPTVTPSYEAATVLIPEYQAPNPSLTPAQQQSAIYKPHEVVIDQSRDLWIQREPGWLKMASSRASSRSSRPARTR